MANYHYLWGDESYATDDDCVDHILPRKPSWLLPANRRHKGDPVPPPKSVLLYTEAYIDGERNATTADGTMSNHNPIQVTFWMAHPPLVSYFTVHCPGLDPDAFAYIPRILATEDDLALLLAPLGKQRSKEFFIYRAGGTVLRRIPDPKDLVAGKSEVGILNCRTDDRFFIAILTPPSIYLNSREKRYLHLFDSNAWAWSTKVLHIESPESCSHTITHKTITVGGERGMMGWVDLCHGILIYDVLVGNDALRFIRLPSLPEPRGNPNSIRDIIVINGCIKYFSMYLPGINTSCIKGDWEADAWKMMDPWENWQAACHLKAADIIVDNLRHYELLPNLPDGDGAKKTVLRRLRAGAPALSLHDEDVVYITTKARHLDHKAWMLAVKMSTKTLQGVADFIADRNIGYYFEYTQSVISKHMGIEAEEDHPLDVSSDQSDEAPWIEVSYKKKKNSGRRPGTVTKTMLPKRPGMSLGEGQRGEQKGLSNGCVSEASGAATVGGSNRGQTAAWEEDGKNREAAARARAHNGSFSRKSS